MVAVVFGRGVRIGWDLRFLTDVVWIVRDGSWDGFLDERKGSRVGRGFSGMFVFLVSLRLFFCFSFWGLRFRVGFIFIFV